MTIEQKAKAYDEALERAKQIILDYDYDEHNNVFMEIFPELMESEDERIKKALIRFHKSTIDIDGIKGNEIVDWIEKQGEQKPTVEMKSAEESLGIDSETYNKIVDECIYGEQKHDDKVEPKFEVGNIITNGKIICKVDENENNKYHGWFGYNKDFSVHYSDIPDIENWHKWTIKDAKDGDVLATEDNCICIFDNTVEEGKYPFAYCGLSMYGFKVYDRTLPFTHDNVYPVTKEQRDLLFQKMKESRYEWDAEKKELRKIEQKPAEWKQENVEELSEFENAMMHIGYSFFGERGGLDPNDTSSVKVQAQYLLELAQKPAEWSEEDEHRVKDTIYFLETAKKHYASTVELDACIDWLKSLKPQNRDTYNPYKEVVSSIAEMCDKYKSFSDDRANDFVNNVKVKCKDAKEYDSIYPQNTWKPSEDQMDALYTYIYNPQYFNSPDPRMELVISVYEDLKKLMENNYESGRFNDR